MVPVGAFTYKHGIQEHPRGFTLPLEAATDLLVRHFPDRFCNQFLSGGFIQPGFGGKSHGNYRKTRLHDCLCFTFVTPSTIAFYYCADQCLLLCTDAMTSTGLIRLLLVSGYTKNRLMTTSRIRYASVSGQNGGYTTSYIIALLLYLDREILG